MKLILAGLLIASLIQWYPAYTQTDAGASIGHKTSLDPVYCLPIEKARLLVRDALRLRLADSLLQTQSARIVLLADEKQSLILSYTKLLKISEEKTQYHKEISAHMESLAGSFRQERDYYQKRERKQRRKTKVLTVIVVGLTGALLVK